MNRSILVVFLSLLGWACGGAEFSTVEASGKGLDGGGRTPDVAHRPDASTVEISSVDGPWDASPLDAGEASLPSTCDTPDEFQRECELWIARELDDAGACWDRCGTCTSKDGAQILCLKRSR
jgi:hypothetical protein